MNINLNPRVFLSYTHDSEKHKQMVLDFADKLNYEGIDCWCDRYIEGSSPEKGWPSWMEENMRVANFIFVICTELYLKRYEGKEVPEKGHGAAFESVLFTQHIYENKTINKKVIPILFSKDDKAFIPAPLTPYSYYFLYDDYDALYRRITNQIKITKPTVGKVRILDKVENINEKDAHSMLTPSVSHDKVEEAKIESSIPLIPEIIDDMKSGLKIVQAFFTLPITQRFKIASSLDLLEPGESYTSDNREEISSQILIRAKSKGVMASLWSALFDETIEPNPFK
jgi:hypothetical protein